MENEKSRAYSGYPSVDRPWLKFYKSKINDTPAPECSIYEYLWENNKNYLADTALIYKNEKITYEQLFINIDQIASALINLGVSSGDIVVMYLPAIPEEVYLLYAINRIGAIAHYLFPQTPVNNICDTLNLLKTKVFICTGQIDIDENIVYRSTQIQRIIRVGLVDRENIQSKNPRTLSWNTFLVTGRKEIREYKNPNEVCFIAKTGGTTGIPKNVIWC